MSIANVATHANKNDQNVKVVGPLDFGRIVVGDDLH